MSNKILIDEAVVKQALEALDGLSEPYDVLQAQTALRQAIADAALDKMAENARELGLSYEQPAPAQEPSSLAKAFNDGVFEGALREREHWLKPSPAPAQEPDPDELTIAYMSGVYEGKKRKPWVGLTDEEIDDIEATWEATQEWVSFSHATRVIEAKLKEKNTKGGA